MVLHPNFNKIVTLCFQHYVSGSEAKLVAFAFVYKLETLFLVVHTVLIFDFLFLLYKEFGFQLLNVFDIVLRELLLVAFLKNVVSIFISFYGVTALEANAFLFRNLFELDYKSILILLDSPLHARVPMIFDGVVSPAL